MRRTHPFVPLAGALAASLGGLACIGVAACASSKTHLVPPPVFAEDTIPDDSTAVSVQNNGLEDANIDIVREDGIRYRLGMAISTQTTVFLIPKYMLMGAVTNLRFVATPLGGARSAVSQTTYVSVGDHVDMIIPPG